MADYRGISVRSNNGMCVAGGARAALGYLLPRKKKRRQATATAAKAIDAAASSSAAAPASRRLAYCRHSPLPRIHYRHRRRRVSSRFSARISLAATTGEERGNRWRAEAWYGVRRRKRKMKGGRQSSAENRSDDA
jgi:hypothetical protein